MIANANRTGKGFTLAELLVVVSVIIILMSMLVVCVNGLFTYFVRLQCQNRMEQLWNACLMYSNKHRILPSAWDFDQGRPWYAMLVASGYLDSAEVCNCPSSDLISKYGTGTTTVSGSMPSETKEAIYKTLNWMKATQRSDGGWGGGTVGQAGLGLLSFLGAGCTTTQPEKYADTVEKALTFLINHVQSNGDVSPLTEGKTYDYGVALIPLCDAYHMMGDFTPPGANKSIAQAAQLVLDFQVPRANIMGAFAEWWGATNIYGLGGSAQARDNSTSCWNYQGVHAAYRTGLTPTTRTWDQVLGSNGGFNTYATRSICVHMKKCISCNSYVDRSAATCHNGHTGFTDVPDVYWVGYFFDTYDPLYGYVYGVQSYDWAWGNSRERQTAASLLCRLLLGHGLAKDPANPADRTYSNGENAYNVLQWLREGNKHIQLADGSRGGDYGYDVYYIYYATLAFWAAGGSYWDEWANGNDAGFDGYIEPLIARMTNAGTGPDGPKGYYWQPQVKCFYDTRAGIIYPTALATIAMEVSVGNYIPGSKFNRSVAGEHSYGYNNLIANDENGRRRPAGDTIIMMDYMLSGIDPADDPAECIAPRHGGKVNVLFGDGHTEALAYEDLIEEKPGQPGEYRIKRQMLSLKPGSEGHLEEDE